MNEQTSENVSNTHTAWKLGTISWGCAAGWVPSVSAGSCPAPNIASVGRAGSQGCLPDCDFTGPGALASEELEKINREEAQAFHSQG